MGEQIPEILMLDRLDWTAEDVLRHIKADVSVFNEDIVKALNGKSKTEETDNIQNFVGRMRSWLRLYAAVTGNVISTLYA